MVLLNKNSLIRPPCCVYVFKTLGTIDSWVDYGTWTEYISVNKEGLYEEVVLNKRWVIT